MHLQIGVKILIQNSQQSYLFIKRTDLLQNEQEVSWDIPGGRIEVHENLKDALNREVFEELGIQLNGNPELINAQDIFVASKDLHVVRLTYRLVQDLNKITLSHEHQAYKWSSLDEISEINIEPYLMETLRLLR